MAQPYDDPDLAELYRRGIVAPIPNWDPASHDLDLMDRFRREQSPASPVPRGTSVASRTEPLYVPQGDERQNPYGSAMGLQEPEPMGPPERAERVDERSGQSRYRGMVDEYLQSLQTPYRLPEPEPYSRREKLGMLAARQPWQREMIVERHRAPYERAMAEAGINQRRAGTAAGIASDLERADAYERSRRDAAERRQPDFDYTDKVEQANAEKGNTNYPYTRGQWKSLADHNASLRTDKAPATREAALEDIDKEIRADEGRYLQATSDAFGGYIREESLEGERKAIVGDVQKRRASLQRRRKAVAGMTPDIYSKFRNLTAEQQDAAIEAYEKRQSGQPGGGQPGPVAPSQPYYP